jgi:beta-lactam-binding protein with PASTA domain
MVVKNVNRDYNGLVLSESPQRGTSVAPGTTVTLFVEEYVPAAPTGPTGPTGASGTT